MFSNEACEGVDDRSVTNLLVKDGIGAHPLVRIHLAKSLHQKLGPQFHKVAGAWENGLILEVTRNAVIDLNATLFAHKSQLDPVLAAG